MKGAIKILFLSFLSLTGRNRTGPPCSVGRPATHAPDGEPARPPAALQTTTDDDDSEQNYTGPLGGPVITYQTELVCAEHQSSAIS